MALLSVAIAALSWRLVERPALQRVSWLANWLERCFENVRRLRAGHLFGRVAPQPPTARLENEYEARRRETSQPS
jgi:peptidoglycan/LPS O-acetylase OafA/YrhL